MTSDRYLTGTGADAMAIIAAFGMGPQHNVTAITFSLEAGDLARVSVERLVRVSEARRLAAVVEHFRMVPRYEPYGRGSAESLANFVSRMVREAMQRLNASIDARSCQETAA